MTPTNGDAPACRSAVTSSAARRCFAHLQKNWLRALLLVLVGVAVRAPALGGELVWDDLYLARDNPFIKSPLLVFETFRHHLFLDSLSGHYRPVQNISFVVDYFVWNTDTSGFHLTNILLHVGSGVLLYYLLRKLLLSLRPEQNSDPAPARAGGFDLSIIAWLVALLWTVHPVHSAAVDYISGRADSLAFLFACGAWLLVLAARARKTQTARISLYASAAFCALLALCSREIAGIWIVIFLFHVFFFENKLSKRAKLLTLACCIGLLGVYGGLRQLPETRSNPEGSSAWTAPTRAVLMLRALGDYGRLMIFPSRLHMERSVVNGDNYASTPRWRSSVTTEYLSIAGVLVAAALFAGCVRDGRGRRLRVFGAAWFLLGYLPISNLFDLNATSAEHWLYLPSVGFLLFLAGCAIDLPIRYRTALAAVACVAVVGLSIRSTVRSSDWVTEETFYTRTLAAGGVSVRVKLNLGMIHSRRGDYAKAEAMFRDVLRAWPDYPVAKNNLADVLHRQNKPAEAEAIFAQLKDNAATSRKEHSRTWMAALNLARMKHGRNDTESALAVLKEARAAYPHTWEIISFQSELLRQTHGPDAAVGVVGTFARDHWWHYRAHLALGKLLAEKGEVEQAAAAFRQASRLDIHDAEALSQIAAMRLRQNNLQEAYASQRRAVARQPDQPRQYLLLSDILERMGRSDEARAMVAKVTRLEAIAQSQPVAN